MFPPFEVLCQLNSKAISSGNSLKGLAVEDLAGGDPVPFLGHSQLMTFLCVE